MKLSTKGRYAVMAMSISPKWRGPHRFGCRDRRTSGSARNISNSSLSSCEKRSGASARGPGGGYRLARGAPDIVIYDIIAAVDDQMKMTPL